MNNTFWKFVQMFTNIIEKIVDFFCGRIYDWWAAKQHDRLLTSLNKDLEIYQLIEVLSKELSSDRIILTYLHNGGGTIIPGKPKYISAIIEKVRNDSTRSRKEDFQRMVVGGCHLLSIISMLFDEENILLTHTEDLPQSKLKDVYHIDNIKTSIMAYIASNSHNVWYLNINFKDETELDDIKKDRINFCRSKIANILEQYFTLTHRA
jgi:hypothetical protein